MNEKNPQHKYKIIMKINISGGCVFVFFHLQDQENKNQFSFEFFNKDKTI